MSNTDAHFNEEDNPTMNSNDEDDQPPPLIPREQVYFPSLNDPESHAHYYYHPDSADSDEEDGDVGLPPDSDEDPDDNEDDFDDDLEDATEGDEEADHQDNAAENPRAPNIGTGSTTFSKPPDVYDFSLKNPLSPRQWVEQWYHWTNSLTKESPDYHPSGLPDDVSLLKIYLEDPNYQHGWNIISAGERAEISLMNRLNGIKGCPLYVYDCIREWAKDSTQEDDDDLFGDHVINRLRSREQVLRTATKRAHTSTMEPSTNKILLEGCSKRVNLTSMSYIGNLYDQLTDQELVNDNTLLLNGPTPYDNPCLDKDYVLNDFNTGTRYVEAWNYKKKSGIDFPLGEVFFVDKSVLDTNDRLSFEPVMHTNSLINCSARYKSSAWHNLGCLPQFKGLGHNDYEDKLNDYQTCLGVILQEYIELQQNKAGLLWPLSFGGKLYMIRFRPYVLTVLGDTPGQNAMTGKMSKCNRLCRYCTVEKEDLSKPFTESAHMTVAEQSRIQATETLRQIYCYKKVNVIWNECCFGNDPHGIHGNVPAETMHAVEKGLDLRTNEVVVATPSLSAAARKKDRQDHIEHCASVRASGVLQVSDVVKEKYKNPTAPTQDELLRNGAFGGVMGKMVNAISVVLGEQLSHQSDRNICRLYFPQGIMSRSKTTASEQQGLTFLMIMILASTWSLKKNGLRDRLGDQRIGSYIKILEHIIMLEEIMKIHPGKSPRTPRASDIPAIALYTQMILSLITDSMHRAAGDGFNLIKFHLIIHMIHDMHKYGLSRNVSGSPGESQFKKNFKLPAETTQMRPVTFEEQVCKRHHQNITINRCAQVVKRIEKEEREAEHDDMLSGEYFGHLVSLRESEDTAAVSGKVLGENTYSVMQTRMSTSLDGHYTVDMVFKGRTDSARAVNFPYCCENEGYLIGRDGVLAGSSQLLGLRHMNPSFSAITDFLSPVIEANDDLRINVYTTLKVPKTRYQDKDVLYRADPFCFVGLKERHDWSLIEWEESGLVPGQILGFLDIDEKLMHAYNETSETEIPCPGKYAMVYSMKNEIPGLMDPSVTVLDSDHVMQSNSVLLFYGEREVDDDGKLVLRLVDVESFVRPLIVVPDFDPTFSTTGKGVNIDQWIRSAERKNSFIVVRPRDLWHLTFLELAQEHYDSKNPKNKKKSKKT
jgi:hypothetical protein